MKRIRLLSLQPGHTSRSRKLMVLPVLCFQSPWNATARSHALQTPGRVQDSRPAAFAQELLERPSISGPLSRRRQL